MTTVAASGAQVSKWRHPDYVMPRKVRVEKDYSTGYWHAWVRIDLNTKLDKYSTSRIAAVRWIEKQLWRKGWTQCYEPVEK